MSDLFGRERPVGNYSRKRLTEPSEYDRNFWSKVYAFFLSELPLLKEDSDELKRRGLTDEEIAKTPFRSLHPSHNDKALQRTYDAFRGRVWDVPGFVRRPDRSLGVSTNRGLVIPLIDPNGAVRACQVRTGLKGSKYLWFTRSDSVGREVHFARRPVSDTWIVTEGPLKAQVAQEVLDRELKRETVVGLGGVSNWQSLVPYVSHHKPKLVILAFDADKAEKPGVKAAEEQLAKSIKGTRVVRWNWSADQGKGLDDILVAGGQIEEVS